MGFPTSATFLITMLLAMTTSTAGLRIPNPHHNTIALDQHRMELNLQIEKAPGSRINVVIEVNVEEEVNDRCGTIGGKYNT
jgi:hypothetical protein